eukprot:1651446-Pleurochrysis_carterae.AAC.2
MRNLGSKRESSGVFVRTRASGSSYAQAWKHSASARGSIDWRTWLKVQECECEPVHHRLRATSALQ